MHRPALLAAALVAIAAPAAARITALEITHTEHPALGGAAFGAVGQYEWLTGTARGELDPADPANAAIQDLALAPRNAAGRVEYAMDVAILRPAIPAQGNGTLLYDVLNRGRKLAPGVFEQDWPGFLEAQGFTLVWSGWQGDLPAEGTLMRLAAPLAHAPDGGVLTGTVRKEYELFSPTDTLALGDTDLGRGLAYPAVIAEAASAVLTERVRQADAPQRVPRAEWEFADCRTRPFPGTSDATRICRRGGFDTDHVYELLYTARDPVVMGIGFAATRDLVAFLRGATADPAGRANPLAGSVQRAIAHGTSQSGRFLRSFLDLGFNRDEQGRRVFDAMNIHIAAAKLALNQRFAQPSAASMQHEEHLAPTQDAPLGWDAILQRCRASATCPQIFQELSSTEYWNSRASLDTTEAGEADAALPPEVHAYHVSSTQHVLGLKTTPCALAGNPNGMAEVMRALLVRLQALLVAGTAPPPSRYPRVADATLLPPPADAAGFARVPGLAYAGLVNDVPLLDRGPDFDAAHESGVLREPPRLLPGAAPPVLVPALDADGNETGGVRTVTLAAPLGTYVGWNRRRAGFAEGELCYLAGSFVPFARTEAERRAASDPRPSLAERYGDHDGYVAAVARATAAAEADGFLLAPDAERLRRDAAASQILK